MATHLLEAIQKEMGFPPVQKIDPNNQETKARLLTHEHRLAQAAIPAVLAGLFAFTRSDNGCNSILLGRGSDNWLDIIFEDKKEAAVEKVAHYAGIKVEEAATVMEHIAHDAVEIIHKAPGERPTVEKVRSYMRNQRHDILVHLPAALQLGDLLHDNGMDDRTNKMEGPVSNFMHKIENQLSGGDA